MSKILYARPYIDGELARLKKETERLAQLNLPPKLRVILVGDNKASLSYVKRKKQLCEAVGALFELRHLPIDTNEDLLVKEIEILNADNSVTGGFVQLPLPKHLQHVEVTDLVDPMKDVDGLNSLNVAKLYKGIPDLVSCTPKGIVTLLKFYGENLRSKKVCIIGRSKIVGRPLSLLCQHLQATVTVCHKETKNLREHTQTADYIIIAVGHAKLIDASYLRETKDQVVVDVGINYDANGKICGDTDFQAIKDKVRAITPVPGGVGPMTVVSLIENLIFATNEIMRSSK